MAAAAEPASPPPAVPVKSKINIEFRILHLPETGRSQVASSSDGIAIVGGKETIEVRRDYRLAASAPPTADMTTTSHGGVRHLKSSRNATIPSAKSAALVIPAVHTGL